MEFNDSFIVRVGLALAFIGMILIAGMSFASEPKKIKLSEISREKIGERVSVKGFVRNPFLVKNVLLFRLESEKGKIKAVVFSPVKEELELLSSGKAVEVIGAIKEYRGELEIVVEEARVLR